MKKTPYQKCYNLALYYLAKRQHSVNELSKKLKDKEFLHEDIAKTIKKLKELAFLDDYQFAFSRIRYRYETSRWGIKRIILELKNKGVEQWVIDSALSDRFSDNTLKDEEIKQQAYELLSRYQNKIIITNKRLENKDYAKLSGFLARRGYSIEQIKYAIDKFILNYTEYNDN